MFLVAPAQILPVLFLPLNIWQHKNKSRHVLQVDGHKNPDKNKCRRDGSGEACIYVGNYVSFYIDKKLNLWHLEKQRIEKCEA